MEDYKDIIDLPHHEPTFRPRMDILDRAAQFAPYAALVGYGDLVEETRRLTDEEIIISEDEKEKIDIKLQIIQQNPNITVQVTYFVPDAKKDGGSYQTKTGTIKRIDPIENKIIFTDKTEIRIDRINDIYCDAFEGYENL